MTDPTLTLGDSLDMTAAGPLHKELLGRRGKPVTLDASQVRRLGGQCLQVLLSAQSTWAADGADFQIVNPSPEFADGLALMGAAHLAPAATLSPVQD
ncbi:STAS domain-containing protein [Phenylobacterium sp.]|uniref:STAS domain-containing protein n=1 Tax=Phenylobacterium sp. TaxID=1871053 RepID=UPI0025D113BD|nr:STAS domain-containing protein [Phenylobacterium sp.]